MKYLKYINESSSSLKLTWVDFTGGGDGIYALYINSILHKYGDYYHDKIEEWFGGFKDGLEYLNINFEYESIKLPNDNRWIEETWDLGGVPPKNIDDLWT